MLLLLFLLENLFLDAPGFAVPQFSPPGQWMLIVSTVQDKAPRYRLDEIVSCSNPDKFFSLFVPCEIWIHSCTFSLRTNTEQKHCLCFSKMLLSAKDDEKNAELFPSLLIYVPAKEHTIERWGLVLWADPMAKMASGPRAIPSLPALEVREKTHPCTGKQRVSCAKHKTSSQS